MPMRPRLLLLALVATTVGSAAWLRTFPPGPRPADGRVWGGETVVLPGATTLVWEGPYRREGSVTGTGRFPVWQDPLWAGSVHIPGATLVVDPPVSWRAALPAGIARTAPVQAVLLVLLCIAILRRGTVADAVLLALWLRGIHALDPAWVLGSDPARYHQSALDVLGGRMPHPLWPPGWPIVLAGAYAVLGADPVVGRLVGAGLGGAFVALAARVAPERARVATALLAAISAELVGYAPSLFAEPLFLVASVSMLESSGARAGLAAAVAALTRAHAVAVALPAGLLREGRRAFLLAFLVPLALWSLARGAIGVSDGLGMNLWIGHRPGADGDWHDPWPEPGEGFRDAAIAAIRADPGAAAGRVARNVGRLWSASTSDPVMATRPLALPLVPYAALVALAAIGLVRWRPPALIVWLALTTITTSLFFVPVRYKLGLYPALVPLAGAGLAAIVARMPLGRPRVEE